MYADIDNIKHSLAVNVHDNKTTFNVDNLKSFVANEIESQLKTVGCWNHHLYGPLLLFKFTIIMLGLVNGMMCVVKLYIYAILVCV